MGRFFVGSVSQGLNILLNLFFGPAVNAARGIAVQVQGAVTQFSTNFQTAVNPQITKSYATGDYAYMHNLIFRSSKFTFLLLVTISFPIFLETEMILQLWLGTVPCYTAVFVRLMLCVTIMDAMAGAFMISVQATGRVRVYQSVVGGILLTIVPLSWLVLKAGGAPWSVFVVHLAVCLCAFVARLFILRPLIHLSLFGYFLQVICRCISVLLVAVPLPLVLLHFLPATLSSGVLVCLSGMLLMFFSSYLIGLTGGERRFVDDKVLSFLKIKK